MSDRPSAELLNRALFDSLLAKAAASPRRRINHNFHTSMADNPHRFLNVMLHGTYITPHRHLKPPKSESFVLLEGRLGFVLFREDGEIDQAHILEAGAGAIPVGIDILPGLWHSIVVLSEHAVCFEVKPGPYEPSDDKEFAPFAPAEGTPGAPEYLAELTQRALQKAGR